MNTTFRHLLAVLLAAAALALAGCANVAKISTGEVVVDNRLSFTLDAAWNQVNLPGRARPVLWTQDGITVDALELWIGIKDGQAMIDTPKDKRPLVFKATMAPHEVVGLFEGIYGLDGSTFTLEKLAPVTFLGGPGFRFDYTVLRKADDVRISGVGWAALKNGELVAMTFVAPRLGFFPRHLSKAERAAATARLR
jgi:hypothetical protein